MTSETIIANLISNKEFIKRVLPFIKEEYFESNEEKAVFRHLKNYTEKFGTSFSYDVLYVELNNDKTIAEKAFKEIDNLVGRLKSKETVDNIDWLINKTEEFCKTRSLYNAIFESVGIFDGTSKKYDRGAIPDLLSEALAVSFDASVGHDYFDDAEKRHEYYHRKEEKVSLGLECLDKITKGGVSKKTLSLLAAGPHAGKTALMCHIAAANLRKGKNVLYVSFEMSEEEIARRIDSNMMDERMDDVMNLSKKMFSDRLSKIQEKTRGRLKIKEYPTASAHAGHIKTLLNELNLKQNLVPDLILVDYLNIMASSRIKAGSGANSYSYVKSITEELRGLAGATTIPIITATQMNRGASSSTDMNMDGIAESFGTAMTADFILGLMATEELIQQGHIMATQLKNRFEDMNKNKRFLLGFNRDKMKFYDVNDSVSDTPLMDKIASAERKPLGDKFNGFKFAN